MAGAGPMIERPRELKIAPCLYDVSSPLQSAIRVILVRTSPETESLANTFAANCIYLY